MQARIAGVELLFSLRISKLPLWDFKERYLVRTSVSTWLQNGEFHDTIHAVRQTTPVAKSNDGTSRVMPPQCRWNTEQVRKLLIRLRLE